MPNVEACVAFGFSPSTIERIRDARRTGRGVLYQVPRRVESKRGGKSRDSSVLRLPVGCGSAIIYASGRAATNRPLPNGRTTWGGPNANDMRTSDPYYEWLGIPPKDQPPNHYRLLGLELFEENRNVIDAAANRQMGFIKEYQAGPDSELSQKLLNELSAARLCLLSPPAKAAYDQQLRAQLKAQAAPAPAMPIPPALRWRNEPDPPPPRAPRWKYFAKPVGERDPAPRSHAA